MEKDTKKLELITVSTPWDFDDVTVPAGVHSINNADVYEDDLGEDIDALLLPNADLGVDYAKKVHERQKRYFSFKFSFKHLYITLILCTLDIIMIIVEFILNKGWNKGSWWVNIEKEVLILLGGNVTWLIQKGEVHRLVVPVFLHVGLLHLLFNMITKLFLGLYIERAFGPIRLIFVYSIATIGGNLASAIFLPRFIQVGASTAIFGMLAVYYVDLILNWRLRSNVKIEVISLVISTVLTIGLGLFPMVDNFSHFGGFVSGVLASLMMIPNLTLPSPMINKQKKRILLTKIRVIVSAVLLIVLWSLGFWVLFAFDLSTFCSWCEYLTCLPIFPECKNKSV